MRSMLILSKIANGMSGKISSSFTTCNGSPVPGTHKAESIDHPGTGGPRVNGAANVKAH